MYSDFGLFRLVQLYFWWIEKQLRKSLLQQPCSCGVPFLRLLCNQQRKPPAAAVWLRNNEKSQSMVTIYLFRSRRLQFSVTLEYVMLYARRGLGPSYKYTWHMSIFRMDGIALGFKSTRNGVPSRAYLDGCRTRVAL
jgi:hypothetical protein